MVECRADDREVLHPAWGGGPQGLGSNPASTAFTFVILVSRFEFAADRPCNHVSSLATGQSAHRIVQRDQCQSAAMTWGAWWLSGLEHWLGLVTGQSLLGSNLTAENLTSELW